MYSEHNSPERDQIMDEMGRQELVKETRAKISYCIQWIILILTIIVVVFTVFQFTKEKTTSDIISKKRKSIGSANTNNIQSNKQNDTQKDIKNNIEDVHNK